MIFVASIYTNFKRKYLILALEDPGQLPICPCDNQAPNETGHFKYANTLRYLFFPNVNNKFSTKVQDVFLGSSILKLF